ncbi:unnamed protein product [Ixodes pacificus]
MVASNNMLFNIRFEMNCDIHCFRTFDRSKSCISYRAPVHRREATPV